MMDDVEKVTYKKAIVSFIDILGFRGLVEGNKNDSNVVLSVLKNFEEKVHYYRNHLIDEKEKMFDDKAREFIERNKIYFFSDSIVMIQECIPGVPVVFYNEILTILDIQSHLSTEGIFIRGGVTYGDIFYEKNRLFGPAMMRAYDLESRYADFPRIILDERCRYDFNYPIDWALNEGKLKKDKDGFLCIDYFNLLGPDRNFGEERIGLRGKIKFHIEKNIEKYKNKERIIRKYHWLANEYNETFSKEGSHIDIEKLLAE